MTDDQLHLVDWEICERWCHGEAYRLVPPSNATKDAMHDDLAQEGLIAMYRSLESFDPTKGAIVSWMQRAATMRMRGLAYGRNLPLSTEVHPPADAKPTLYLDKPVAVTGGRGEGGEEITLGQVVLTEDEDGLIDQVSRAYHRGDLARALDELEPEDREYVVRRFWYDHKATDIAAERGVSNSFMSRRWLERIRPQLVEALAHLQEAA